MSTTTDALGVGFSVGYLVRHLTLRWDRRRSEYYRRQIDQRAAQGR